jgi:hypothetical protein
VRRWTNNAALAAVVGVEGEFDADINAPLLPLRTGTSLGIILLILFLAVALPLALAFSFPLLLAARANYFVPIPLSPATAVCLIQQAQSGQSG